MREKNRKIENIEVIFFLGMLFIIFLMVMFKIPYNGAPDEEMRYQIAEYVYEYLRLPRGDDPQLLNAIWGTSYGFTPINSYIFSGILMKIASLVGVGTSDLYFVARLVSVFFSMGTAVICIKIGKRLFEGIYVWLFVFLVTLLPQFVFISGYVNCDALAIFSVAWVIYAMIRGKELDWNKKSCISLGAGLGCCALSYYNAYGVILFAIVYCVLSVCLDKNIENKVVFLLQRMIWTGLTAFVVAGWWFIRNGILYDGDILGMNASKECSELNAIEEFKPSNRATPANLGYSLKYMLIDMGWIRTSARSFVATFGWMEYYVEVFFYIIYNCIVAIGLCAKGIDIFSKCLNRRKNIHEETACDVKEKHEGNLFWICMFGICFVTIGLSIYYSYFSDFQPQGRYCLPMLIAMALLITSGVRSIEKKINPFLGRVFAFLISIFMFTLVLYSIFCVLLIQY